MKRGDETVNEPGGAARRSLPPEVRRSEILGFLREHEGVSVAELAEAFDVSSVTVHRDLERLASQGVLERIRGGARLRADVAGQTDWHRRVSRCDAQKRAIAEVAVEMVAPHSTIFVDSSTTCFALAEALATRPGMSVSIVTNSPAIAFRLRAPSVHVVVVPGELNQELRLIAGSWATEFLSKLHFRRAFVSGSGITATNGLGSMTRPLADVLRAAVSVSDETVALVDSSKFDHPSLVPVARLDELTCVITDDGLARPARQRYKAAGARLIVADGERAERSPDT
ncbi:MAG: DeoR/GlpR family DNA-binding transcription regulator [Gaiellales bacterium]